MGKAKQRSEQTGDEGARSNDKRARGKKAPPRRLFRRIVVYSLAAMVWAGLAGALGLSFFATNLPDIDEAVLVRRPNVVILDTTGAEIASVGDIYRGAVRVDQLPPYVPGAILSVEDRRFYSHFGVDLIGLARALVVDIRAGAFVQGASTITQQVARNLFLTPDKTITRKIKEALLAIRLEQKFTKDEILTLYLNRVYFGAGTYGIEAAAERYFSRPAASLSVYQAAVLAGLLRAPSRYSPTNSPKQSADRAAVVLRTMIETGVIEESTAKAAAADGLRNLTAVAAARGNTRGRYFVDWVLSQIDGFVGANDRDLVITTTLDLKLQRAAEDILENHLAKVGAKQKVGQGAIVILSPDGAVRAMVGGRDYGDSQFNRVTQALRQPGSAFKPIVFLAGLENGYTPDDMVTDAPINIGGWKPRNYTNRYEGPVTVETALADSLNTATVRIADHVGVKTIIATARRLGISEAMKRDLTIALGSSDVTLLNLAGAYAPFANGGDAVAPFGIATVGDRKGEQLYTRQPGTLGQVVPPDEVAMMNRMMSQVLIRGTGKAAAFGFPAAGKTGTTSDYRDAWFMGFTHDYIAGVWIGNDDRAEMNKVTGGGLPAQIWHDVMQVAHTGRDPRDLPGLAPVLAEAPPDSQGGGLGGLLEQLFGR